MPDEGLFFENFLHQDAIVYSRLTQKKPALVQAVNFRDSKVKT